MEYDDRQYVWNGCVVVVFGQTMTFRIGDFEIARLHTLTVKWMLKQRGGKAFKLMLETGIAVYYSVSGEDMWCARDKMIRWYMITSRAAIEDYYSLL